MLKGKYITSKQFYNAVITFTLIELCNSVSCIVDGVVTARFLGANALAGVGLGGLYFSLCAFVGFTLAAGGQSLCTYYIGKGDSEKSNRIISSVFGVAVILGALITALGMIFAGPMAYALGAKGDSAILYDYTREYFLGVYIGTIPNILMAAISPLVTLDGKGKLVNISSFVVLGADVALDLFNALVLKWGTFGMGLATSLSFLLAAIVTVSALADKNSLFKLSISYIKLTEIKEIFLSGYSRGVAMIARLLGPICINLYLLALAGTAGLAAFSVQGSVKFICIALPWGISGTVLLMGGNYFGEKDLEGIKSVVRLALRYVCVAVIPLGILLTVFAPQIATLYLSPSDSAYELSVSLLRIFFLSLPVMGLNYVAGSILQVVGRKRETFLFNFANEFAGLVFFVVLMGQLGGIKGAWWAFFVWQVVLLIIYIFIGLVRKSENQTVFTKVLYLNDDFCNGNSKIYSTNIESLEQASVESQKIHQFCVENNISSSDAMKVALCMEELADNVVKHGFIQGKKNALEIRIAIDESKLVLHLRDNCKRFNFSEYIESHNMDFEHPEKGLGIRMVTKMAKDIQYTNTMNVNNLIVII